MKKNIFTTLVALFACTYLFADNIEPTGDQDSTAILLNEVSISAGIKNANVSPLRLKSIDSEKIQQISVAKTFPEILSNTAGVYATRETGSFGDAKINIRGFKQENISILLNGIPISGLTSGNMFWNNWMGLTDATSDIQLQKGIGSSMISDNSVGGTINIVTNSPLKDFGLNLGYYYANYGTQKIYMNINSGDLGKGWAFNLSGSYNWGEGYVECTDVNAWSYLASVSKKVNSKHSFLFTALGSPEHHSQRSQRLTYDEIEKFGVLHNKNWGWYDGKKRTVSRNNYFKPYFTFNHFYKDKAGKNEQYDITVNSAAYLAIGDGGGYFTQAKDRRKAITSFIGDDGHIDWKDVVSYNKNQEITDGGIASQNITSDFMAGHTQFGLKSSAIVDFNDRISLDAGIHYQLYNTWEKEKITDLLGGDYWLDKGEQKHVGDFIRTRNGRNMNYLTAYGMGTFTLGRNYNWILKTGLSVSGVTIRRWDSYNYSEDDKWSGLATGIGGSFKTGLLYKINRNHSLYLNGGIYTRAPYAGVYFAAGNNAITRDVKNENNYLGEIGYRIIYEGFGLEATFYSALWQNKTIKSNPYKALDPEEAAFMITGLDAFHYGGEIETHYGLRNIFRINAFASIGDWRWKNNVNATIYDPYTNLPLEEINVYSDNLHVGDAPQTQVGASFDFHPFNIFDRYSMGLRGKGGRFFANADLSINMDWTYNDRFWSDFDPVTRKNKEEAVDSYRIPAYHILNLNIAWSQKLYGNSYLTIFFNINNLLDTEYVERGKDGFLHDKETFSGYWGAPRNFNFGIRIRL